MSGGEDIMWHCAVTVLWQEYREWSGVEDIMWHSAVTVLWLENREWSGVEDIMWHSAVTVWWQEIIDEWRGRYNVTLCSYCLIAGEQRKDRWEDIMCYSAVSVLRQQNRKRSGREDIMWYCAVTVLRLENSEKCWRGRYYVTLCSYSLMAREQRNDCRGEI